MNNFTSMVVAILEKARLLTEDEAKKLAKELHGSTLPDTYEGASRLLEDLFNKLDIKSLDHKVNLNEVRDDLEVLKADLEDVKERLEGVATQSFVESSIAAIESPKTAPSTLKK